MKNIPSTDLLTPQSARPAKQKATKTEMLGKQPKLLALYQATSPKMLGFDLKAKQRSHIKLNADLFEPSRLTQ